MADAAVLQAIYSLGLDPSAYVSAMGKVTQSNTAGVASLESVQVAEESVTRATTDRAASLDRIVTKYDPVARAQAQYQRDLDTINRLEAAGVGTAAQRNTALATSTTAYEQAVVRLNAGNKSIGQGLGLNRIGLMELQASGINAFQALAAGMDPFRVATMEGAQVLGALVQGGVVGASTFGAFLGPLAAVAATIGAIAGAALLYINRNDDLVSATKASTQAQNDYNDAMDKGNKLMMTAAQAAVQKQQQERADAINGMLDDLKKEQQTLQTLTDAEVKRQKQHDSLTSNTRMTPSQIARMQTSDQSLTGDNSLSGIKPPSPPTSGLDGLNSQIDQSLDRIHKLQDAIVALSDPTQAYKASLDDLTASLKHQNDVAGMSAQQASIVEAGDRAVSDAKKINASITDEQAATYRNLGETLERTKQSTQAAAAAEKDRDAFVQKIMNDVQTYDQAQQNANDTVDRQVESLKRDADAVGTDSSQRQVLTQVMEAENTLRKAGIDLNSDEAQARLANVRAAAEQVQAAQKTVDAQKKAQADSERVINKATDEATRDASNILYDAFSGKISSIGDLLKTTLLRAAADAAAQMIFRPLIQPIMASAISAFGGSAASAAGSAAGGSLSDSSSGLSILSNLASIGKNFAGDIGGFFGIGADAPGSAAALAEADDMAEGQALLANSGDFAPTIMATGAPSMFSMAGLGGLGAGFAAGSILNSLAGGNQTNGMIGSGVGAAIGVAAAALAPETLGLSLLVGGLIGGSAGGLLGGLFGPGESAGPNGVSTIGETSPGRLGRTGASADNGGDPSGVASAVDSVASALNQLADAYNLTLHANTIGGGENAIVFGNGNSAPGVARSAGGLVQNLINTGSIVSSDPHVQDAINSSTADTLEANLQSVTAIINVLKNINDDGSIDPKPLTQTEQALTAINAEFDVFKTQAAQFGFTLDQINQAQAKAIQSVTDGFNQSVSDQLAALTNPEQQALDALQKAQDARLAEAQAAGADLVEVEKLSQAERAQVVEQYTGQATNTIKQFLQSITSGSASPLSSSDVLSGASASYSANLAQAMSGDQTAISGITSSAQDYLNVARTAFASSPQYFSIYNQIKSDLSSLLGNAPGFATGTDSAPRGWRWVGENGPELEYSPGGGETIVSNSNVGNLSRSMVRGNASLINEVRAMRQAMTDLATEIRTSNSYFQRMAARKVA